MIRMSFEQKPPGEDADIAELTRAFLVVQKRFAAAQKRALGRGTHTKGVCCRATFEVFDVSQTIADPALGARLARGVFAKPGVHAATVRFANAASTILPDTKADVRAMSFSIEVPGPGGAAQRHDFTMNNAPVFPINDAHDFAAFMRMRARAGALGQLWEFLKLPFRDKRAILQIAKLGKSQTQPPRGPYQQTRYWSNVPFLHGQDEAIKYSAIPRNTNGGRPLGTGDNALRDELARHLTEDPEPASFDFALQLLDAGRMTHEGTTRDAAFWVENAVPEWKESETPFHVVGRLTLERDSLLADADCQAAYIDVTEHSTPDSRPIGSINRARWSPEAASRKARLENTQEQTMTDSRGLRVRTVFRFTGVVLGMLVLGVFLLALITAYRTHNDHGTLPTEQPVADLVFADQGWGSDLLAPARQTYYYTAQGAGLKDLRYSWFVHLERPLSTRRLAEPEFMRRYGFVVDGMSPANPDGLPVGFSKHFDRELKEEMLDLTCAACHTGQLNFTNDGRRTAVRIDGGSAIHAFTDSNLGHFVPTLMSSIASTAFNPLKFRRFARNVLGDDRDLSASLTLHRQLLGVLGKLGGMGFTEKWHRLVPTEEGYGRTDALARISNTVFGDHLGAANYQVANAPVNYPPVWNIWKFDWVQYNASVSQPMARNIGESMGTGAKYTLVNRYGQPLPAHERFRSSTLLENLHTIEVTLRTLQPPAWNEQVMGAIDWRKAEDGKRLFNDYCAGCHGPHIAPLEIKALNSPLKTAEEPEWLMRTVCVDDIGTDPNTAMNFDRATVDIRRTGLTQADLQRVARRTAEIWNTRQAAAWNTRIAALSAGPQSPDAAREVADLRQRIANQGSDLERALAAIDPARLKVGAALSYLGTMIRDNAYADGRYTAAEQADRDGYGILDMPQVLPAYKPRPLAGIWASPPFLHNGSVPTIYDLLSPVEERPARFRVGSREFDAVKLGLADVGKPYWILDTSKDGNSNKGHEFSRKYVEDPASGTHAKNGTVGPYLTPEQRYAIIEHLKVRNDDLDGPKEPRVPPQCAPTPATQYARGSR
jgi:hypothetical protein